MAISEYYLIPPLPGELKELADVRLITANFISDILTLDVM